jgi:DNA-binding MarR family transcriptional regulator
LFVLDTIESLAQLFVMMDKINQIHGSQPLLTREVVLLLSHMVLMEKNGELISVKAAIAIMEGHVSQASAYRMLSKLSDAGLVEISPSERGNYKVVALTNSIKALQQAYFDHLQYRLYEASSDPDAQFHKI